MTRLLQGVDDDSSGDGRRRTVRLLTSALALLYLVAAVLHTGVQIPLGFVTLGFPTPVRAATIAESLIGTGLATAAVMLFLAPARTKAVVVGIYALSMVFTIVGIVMGPQTWEDRALHAVMLLGVLGGLGILLLDRKNRSASTGDPMSHR